MGGEPVPSILASRKIWPASSSPLRLALCFRLHVRSIFAELAAVPPVSVIERAKNAMFWTPGLTLADLASQALTNAVDSLEKKRGEAFPHRKTELKGGRPMK